MLLHAQNIHRRFGGVHAVDGVSLSVEAGRIVGLIGPNGAGKTTLFNIISGYLRADSGRITFDGADVLGSPPYRLARQGLIRSFQTPTGFPKMTVLENMLVFLEGPRTGLARQFLKSRQRNRISQKDADHVERVLDRFGLATKSSLWVQDLGAPDLKMLEFARATMARPRMLLLDEPAAGVNLALLDRLAATILELRASGVTLLIVDHNLKFICRVCDVIYVMARGRVISAGDADHVVKDPIVIESYIGSSGAKTFEATA